MEIFTQKLCGIKTMIKNMQRTVIIIKTTTGLLFSEDFFSTGIYCSFNKRAA
jgi:hypothetical protein